MRLTYSLLSALTLLSAFAGPPSLSAPIRGSDEVENTRPLSSEEISAWKQTNGLSAPARCRIVRWPNGGWAFTRPDGTPFQAFGIEYEPLALYGDTDWPNIEKDLDSIRDAGFNTVAIWCMNFNVAGGGTRRLAVSDMAHLADLANRRGLFVQFYLMADRFIEKFPRAVLPDGKTHHFDIDYADPGLRAFLRAYAQRLAMALYEYPNVTSLIVWEEKIGIIHEEHGDRISVTALYGSPAGKKRFARWLITRHGDLSGLNKAWGTEYATLEEAVDQTLLEYQRGMPEHDARQFDVLEFGTILLADFARVFVEAYKEVDPNMLFSCRHYDLFGPQRALHPAYNFLDSFGINQYAFGHRGADITFREEIAKAKLAAGMTGRAVYVGNFGFRTASWDGGTHGLVPDEEVKARIAADTVCLFSWIPEVIGTSYFTYYYAGWEGPWGIVDAPHGAALPVYRALQAAHRLLGEKSAYVASSDYTAPPRIHVFNGLDATFLLKPRTWIEHTELSYDLSEMKLNYDVLTDTSPMPDRPGDVIIANFGAYDRMLDESVAKRLLEHVRRGGFLIIGPRFGARNRYGHPNDAMADTLRKARGGLDVSEIKHGPLTILFPDGAELRFDEASYVLSETNVSRTDAFDVILRMQVEGRTQPAAIRTRLGRGLVVYFLFNPYRQKYEDDLAKMDRASLPIFSRLFDMLGISHDKHWSTRGFDLVQGRLRVYEKPIHYYVAGNPEKFGAMRAAVHDAEGENWSGGIIADEFLSYRGRQLDDNIWRFCAEHPLSVGGALTPDSISFFASDRTILDIQARVFHTNVAAEPFHVYTIMQMRNPKTP